MLRTTTMAQSVLAPLTLYKTSQISQTLYARGGATPIHLGHRQDFNVEASCDAESCEIGEDAPDFIRVRMLP